MPKISSKSNSKTTFFTVGPSQIYSTVSTHVENAIRDNVMSMSHRGSDFKDLYKSMMLGLRELLNVPADYEIVVLSSALEAMERVIQSMSHNDTYHILTGYFGKNWMTIAKELSKSPESFEFFNWEKNRVADMKFSEIKIPKKSELVCITQNDTSVGFLVPMDEIYKLKKKNPDKLFALDIVSSVPYVDIEYKYLDAVFFSVQKGFGLPAGLSILILSPDALKKAEKLSKIPGYSIGSYHNLLKLVDKSHDFQTNETPNVLGIYLLDCVIKNFLKIGLSKVRSRLDTQAHMLYSYFSKPESYSDKQDVGGLGAPFIKQPEYQSITTPVFEINGGSETLRKFTAEKGVILGPGYGDFKNKHVRIGNFPALAEGDFEKLFKMLRNYKS